MVCCLIIDRDSGDRNSDCLSIIHPSVQICKFVSGAYLRNHLGDLLHIAYFCFSRECSCDFVGNCTLAYLVVKILYSHGVLSALQIFRKVEQKAKSTCL